MLTSHVDALGNLSSSQNLIDGFFGNPLGGILEAPDANSRMSPSLTGPFSVCVHEFGQRGEHT